MVKRESKKEKKSGFYSKALDEAEKLELEEARELTGLDEEIAVLRIKLRDLIEKEPDSLDLQMKAVTTIARLVATSYNISKEQKKTLKEAIARVLTEIAIPLGIKTLIK